MSNELLKSISTQKAHKTCDKQGSILHYLGTNQAYLAPLGAFPPWRVRIRSAKQSISAHASDVGSCSGHGSWRGLLGESSCSDPKGGHQADYRRQDTSLQP